MAQNRYLCKLQPLGANESFIRSWNNLKMRISFGKPNWSDPEATGQLCKLPGYNLQHLGKNLHCDSSAFPPAEPARKQLLMHMPVHSLHLRLPPGEWFVFLHHTLAPVAPQFSVVKKQNRKICEHLELVEFKQKCPHTSLRMLFTISLHPLLNLSLDMPISDIFMTIWLCNDETEIKVRLDIFMEH